MDRVTGHRGVAVWMWTPLLGSFVAFALCPLAAWSEQAFKHGYVDLAKVFDHYQRTRESETALERKGRQKQTELEGQFKELKQLRQNLELAAEDARETKVREIEEKSDLFSRLKTRSERELVTERNQLARQILEEIDQAVADYARANGFSVILDRRAVLYGQDGDDVTEAVVRLLNERYQSRSAGAKR